MIKKCTCKHKEQDKLHGRMRRVFNKIDEKKNRFGHKWRCTVCNREV